MLAKAVFWGSLGALGWTHVGYPLLAAALARVRGRPVGKREIEPSVTFVVAAHNEEVVIERRLENLLALDYPPEKLEIVVVSDASTDGPTSWSSPSRHESPASACSASHAAGKVAAQDQAVRATSGEILAFSDANTIWKPDALRKLVRNFGDPDVAYVCGAHFYAGGDGTNREGIYARFEGWLRRNESRVGSITAGVGPIYAVRRDGLRRPRSSFRPRPRPAVPPGAARPPRGRRAGGDRVGEAGPRHRGRVPPEDPHVRALLADPPARPDAPAARTLYLLEMVSHRHLRYASGVLHVLMLASSIALVARGSRLPGGTGCTGSPYSSPPASAAESRGTTSS